jgi:hypothetical protein
MLHEKRESLSKTAKLLEINGKMEPSMVYQKNPLISNR